MDGVRTGSGLHEYPEIYKNRYLRVRNKIFFAGMYRGIANSANPAVFVTPNHVKKRYLYS